ncbi:MAG TPA: MFS transporter [Verrucomicrobiae bacterium]|nr:MFS transporter [Verrucomicrobiae bacterium]
MFAGISGNIFILGIVSLLTDVSSEMVYPLIPLFVTTVLGAGPAFLGTIEGVAESTASLLKLLSGMWSDRVRDRKKFVLLGYGISSLSRPLIAIATAPWMVLAVRFGDRMGKGIRTAPRDALVADSVDASVRGKAFGLHRSFDHAGAILGPLAATAVLATLTTDVRTVFWLSAIPGVMAVVLIMWKVKEVAADRKRATGKPNFLTMVPRGQMRTYLLILLLFTLGNSSDAFLLLRASELGVEKAHIPILWMYFHVVKMLFTMPFGALSDKIGRRSVIVAGWGIYSLSYIGFALASSALHVWLLFGIYGFFYAFTEGVEKALMTDIVPATDRGSAFGWYNFAIGVGAFPASVMFGAIWQKFGAAVAFSFGAALAGVAAVLLLALVRPVRTA